MKKIIGISMLTLLFIGIFIKCVLDVGFIKALLIWGIAIFICLWIGLAVKLLTR